MTTPEYPMIRVSKRWRAVALFAALFNVGPLWAATVLDNDYVRVSRDEAPCAQAGTPGCAERVIVAMGEIDLRFGKVLRAMRRGEVAVFRAGESYRPPDAGAYFEVAIKPNRPPAKSPAEIIPPAKNTIVYEGERFFIYEERLAPGDTRERHSHSQRVEIRINQGPLLRQIIDGKDVPQEPPSVVNFREPIIHTVTNVGDMALWNFILEFKPERRSR
jgi:acetylornithine deacetylase/succinyl-diaminopimelate desuccinylase-like protein